MGKREKEFARQLTEQVRPATRNFILSVLLDVPANHAAVVDFGIDSQKHYEALYYPLRESEIMPKDLDAALGHGERLTALVRAAPSNPHKDVEFHTSWDVMMGRERRESAAEHSLQDILDGKAKTVAEDKEQEKDHGIEM